MTSEFDAGLISKEGFETFRPFLGEIAAKDIAAGEQYISIGVSKDGLACGAVTGYPEDEQVFRIVSLYVTPEARRRGAATLLLDELLAQLYEIENNMAVVMEFSDDTEGASEALISFLNARGIPEGSGAAEENAHRFVFFADTF